MIMKCDRLDSLYIPHSFCTGLNSLLNHPFLAMCSFGSCKRALQNRCFAQSLYFREFEILIYS